MVKIRCLIFFIGVLGFFYSSPVLLNAQSDVQDRQERLKKANDLFKAGEEFIREGNYQAANDAFKNAQRVLNGQSQNVPLEALLPKRENYGSDQRENYSASEKEASRKTPKSDRAADIKKADFHFNRAIGLIKKEQYLEAESALQDTIKLNPLDSEAYYNLGIVYEKFLNDKRKALFCYKKYLFLSPNSFDSEMVKYWVEDINRELGLK